MTPIHVLAGLLALAAGAIAFCAVKGGALHRRSGWAFVGLVWTMSSTGAALAAAKGDPLSVLAGVLTFYLVTTALLTVRKPARGDRVIGWLAAIVALGVAVAGLGCGLAASRGDGRLAGYPPVPYLMFGIVALIGGALDLRHLLGTAVTGKHRLARHLWRMAYAMFVATSSFFLGQAKVFPEPMRHVALLSVPVLLVAIAGVYWLVRVLRTPAGLDAPPSGRIRAVAIGRPDGPPS